MSKIVLGFPYSGSLYAFFNDEISKYKAADTTHPYYKLLYGSRFNQVKDIALTLSTLFDELIMIPADSHMPRDLDLGIRTDWETYTTYREQSNDIINNDLEDSFVAKILDGLDSYAKKSIILDTRYCMALSFENNCPIFCGEGTQTLINRLVELDNISFQNDIQSSNAINFLNNYINISGLIFNINTSDTLFEIKNNKEVKEYSKKFIKILEKKANSITTESEMKDLIREYMNRYYVQDNVKMGFNVASKVFNYGSFIPIVGTGSALTSLATGGIGTLTDKKNNNWYEFSAHIQKVSSLELLKKNIK